MRLTRSVSAVLVAAAALTAGACSPAPSDPEPLPWRQFTLGSGAAQGNGPATSGATSADGTVFAFASAATNLVPGDTNNTADTFVRDNGTTTRIAEGASGPPLISADGRFVSLAGNARVFDRLTSSLIDLGVTTIGTEGTAWVSSSGTEAVFGVSNSLFGASGMSCWIRPMNLGPAVPCNPDPNVSTGFLAASADLDRIVVQVAPAGSASEVALVDRTAGTITTLTSVAAPLGTVAISPNGRFVAWPQLSSVASPFPSTVSVFDTQMSTVSTFSPPAAPDGLVQPVAIANDGQTVLAWSYATNLVSGDTNAAVDVFRIDIAGSTAVRVSRTQSGAQLAQQSFTVQHPSAVDGTFTRVALCATDALSSVDTNGQPDCTLVPI